MSWLYIKIKVIRGWGNLFLILLRLNLFYLLLLLLLLIKFAIFYKILLFRMNHHEITHVDYVNEIFAEVFQEFLKGF